MDFENPFPSLGLNDAQVALPESAQLEASILTDRFIKAHSASDDDLMAEIEAEISAFICHLAREVGEGETDEAVLSYYNDFFSVLTR